MKRHKKTKCVVFFTAFWMLIFSLFNAHSTIAADQLKKPGDKRPVTMPANVRPPTFASQKLIIEGNVYYRGRAMPNIHLTLTAYRHDGRVLPLGTKVTDDTGKYSFLLDRDDSILNYKLVPKHPDFASGQHFSPEQVTIEPSVAGKYNFSYTGPLPDLLYIGNGTIKNQGGLAAGRFRVIIGYECDYHSTSHSTCYGNHAISFDWLGPGETKSLDYKCYCWNLSYYGTTIYRTVEVDDTKLVFEVNENNNITR